MAKIQIKIKPKKLIIKKDVIKPISKPKQYKGKIKKYV